MGTGFVLVEQLVTWQAGKDRVRQATLSFSLTHMSAPPDSSVLATDCTDLTSGDKCNVMRAASSTGSASTGTHNLDVVNGSVSLIGSLLNCSAALCAADGIPSDMSHDCDGIAFLESCSANCSDGDSPSTSHLPPCLVDPMAFLSETRRHFIPFVKSCLARAVRSSTRTPWRAWIAPP